MTSKHMKMKNNIKYFSQIYILLKTIKQINNIFVVSINIFNIIVF